MRSRRTDSGPFKERPFFEGNEIDSLAIDELRRVELLPAVPQPVRIDRFIERRYGISPSFDDLPSGVLGFTRFGPKGPAEVVIARALSEDGTRASERRLSSTLAHEAGHMLLHGHLFSPEFWHQPKGLLASDDLDSTGSRILCRDVTETLTANGYDGRWWEYQANQAIGALLLPRPLVRKAVEPFLTRRGQMGLTTLEEGSREEAVDRLAEVFDVNGAVARIRAEGLYPPVEGDQLTL